jgi:hypothetical protein
MKINIEESAHRKFLGLQIDSHLNWKTHINQLVAKLNGACYAVRSLTHIISTLKLIYFACFHSLMKYGMHFWGNSSDSKKIFTLQKILLESFWVQNLKHLVETYLSSYRTYHSHVNLCSHY